MEENKPQTTQYERLNLFDFDLLGMIELTDVEGIEELVTPVGDGTFISRGKAYCMPMTCEEASRMREGLKELLAKYPRGKKAFVIADHMANLSGKVYYEEVQRAINKKNFAGIGSAKRALTEDIANIIAIIEDRPAEIYSTKLPENDDMLASRIIECNNMALLYIFTKNFNLPRGYNILNTGLGGIYIGPFFKNVYGTRWTNLLKSKYVDEVNEEEHYDVLRRTVNPGIFKTKKILLLDDNIGTGATVREIETELAIKGYDVRSGAVQYNWRNFYLVGTGAKDIQRFNPSEIEYITQFNYPGHKLIKHAYQMLIGNMDIKREPRKEGDTTPPGLVYKQYKKEKGYSRDGLSDVVTLQIKGVDNCVKSGIALDLNSYAGRSPGSITPYSRIFTRESMRLMCAINDANSQLYAQVERNAKLASKKKPGGGGPSGMGE